MEWSYGIILMIMLTSIAFVSTMNITNRTMEALHEITLPMKYTVYYYNITNSTVMARVVFAEPLIIKGYRVELPDIGFKTKYYMSKTPVIGKEFTVMIKLPLIIDKLTGGTLYLVTNKGILPIKLQPGVENYNKVMRLSMEAMRISQNLMVEVNGLSMRLDNLNNTVTFIAGNVSSLIAWKNEVKPKIDDFSDVIDYINDAISLADDWEWTENTGMTPPPMSLGIMYQLVLDYYALMYYLESGNLPPTGYDARLTQDLRHNLMLIEQDIRNLANRVSELEKTVSSLEERITDTGNATSTLLFYWSAIDWMDIVQNDWWHGDLIGYVKMSSVEESWAIPGTSIEIPAWKTDSTHKYVSVEFIVYIPGIDSNGYVYGTNNYLAVMSEFLANADTVARVCVHLSIIDMSTGQIVYIEDTGAAGWLGAVVPATVVFKLDPENPEAIFHGGTGGPQSAQLSGVPTNLRSGWYIVNLTFEIWAEEGSGPGGEPVPGHMDFGLKSIAMYITNNELW